MPQTFRIGYCTSGFGSHRLEDALEVIAGLGYRGVFLTLDVGHLDPFAADLPARVDAVRKHLQALDLHVVVETGARFLLDPWHKHQPTLVSPEGRERRLAFLKTAFTIARDLNADCVSLWSGTPPPDQPTERSWELLQAGLESLLEHSHQIGVPLAFEPEPGMLVQTVRDWQHLLERLGTPQNFGLSLDVGHLVANEEGDPAELIRRFGPHLLAVALEDMRPGIHDHLPFGEGTLDLPAVVRALKDTGFLGVVAVELARHGHDAVRVATHCREALLAAGARFNLGGIEIQGE